MTTAHPYDWLTGEDGAQLLARGTTPDEVRATVQLALEAGNDGTEPWPLLDTDAEHWRIDDGQDLTPGWYRKNPCSASNCWDHAGTSGAHAWHLGDGHQGQPGAFLAATVTITADQPEDE